MATLVLTNAQVLVNSIDLSNRVRKVTVKMTREDKDMTAMGASGKARLAGLGDDSFEVEWNQDFAASNVDATLYPLLGAAPFTVEVRPVNGARSTTNPGYNGSAILTDYTPIDGSVGDEFTASTTFPVSGIIARSTS